MSKEDSAVLQDLIKKEEKEQTSDFWKTNELLLNDKFKRRKTILNNTQVPDITTIDVLAQIYDIEFLQLWIDSYGEWRTSGDGGKGRQDIVEISKFQYAEMKNSQEQLMNILRGKQ